MKKINFENVIAPREFVRKITAYSYLFGYADTANAIGFINNIPVIFKGRATTSHLLSNNGRI